MLRNYRSPRNLRKLEDIIQKIFKKMQVNRSLRIIGESTQRKKKQLEIDYILEVHGRKRESQFNKLCNSDLSKISTLEFKKSFPIKP